MNNEKVTGRSGGPLCAYQKPMHENKSNFWIIGKSRLQQDIIAQGYMGEGNAALFSAAPELLNALQRLERLYGECSSFNEARAAIAKATGGSQ